MEKLEGLPQELKNSQLVQAKKGLVWSKTITSSMVPMLRLFFVFNQFHNIEVDSNVYKKIERKKLIILKKTFMLMIPYS